MYNINAIVPLKRLNDFTECYELMMSFGYDAESLKKSYFELLKNLQGVLGKSKTKTYDYRTLIYNYKFLKDNNICQTQGNIVLSNDFNFNIRIKGEKNSRNEVEGFVQSVLMNILNSSKKGTFKWRLIDAKNAGSSFGKLINVANSDRKNYGGQVFSNENDIYSVLVELEKSVEENMVQLGGLYDSVFSYNLSNEKKIPVTTLVVFDYDLLKGREFEKLKYVISNSRKAGINIVLVTFSEQSPGFAEEDEFVLHISNDKTFIIKNDFEAECDAVFEEISDADIKRACEKEVINSIARNYFNVRQTGSDFDFSDKISIPFAVNEYGEVCNLEIGGTAPPHALISGATGSGKSVLLHTIIDSIILHYHPDDVEIWAIDYKAVEFACYVKKRTPHITVIGQDKSEDFSYSLLDLINKEYNRRKKVFIQSGVKGLEGYRRSGFKMSRIVIVIDEFHNLTQAVQQDTHYKTMLENLLSEMRAMGMSFVFCSQTISSGLQGLTEKGRNQIGCRMCMKQSSIDEIKATLAETLSSSSRHCQNIINFGRGQIVYKKAKQQGYDYQYLTVLYIDDEMREEIIDSSIAKIGDNYEKRQEVICKNSERFSILEKKYHTINKFLREEYIPEQEEGISFFPAAPTSLEEDFAVSFVREPSNNLIICGESDNLRESLAIFSVMSLLMDEKNKVNVSLFDAENNDSIRLKNLICKIHSDRLNVFCGGKECFDHVYTLRKIKPSLSENVIEVFYGVNKIKSITYLLNDEETTDDTPIVKPTNKTPALNLQGKSKDEKLAAIELLQKQLLNGAGAPQQTTQTEKSIERKTYKEEEILDILVYLFEHGPDFGYYNFLIANSVKQLKQAGIKSFKDFDYRIGMEMSSDDSYALFASENFVNKANSDTVVYYAGSNKKVKTLRPYLLPDDEFLMDFNRRIKQ